MSEQAIRQRLGMQRVGILGGSFDPIHIGHLLIAEYAREQLRLSEVRFIPAAISPLKKDKPPTDAKHRVEMIRLAIGGNAHFGLDEREPCDQFLRVGERPVGHCALVSVEPDAHALGTR